MLNVFCNGHIWIFNGFKLWTQRAAASEVDWIHCAHGGAWKSIDPPPFSRVRGASPQTSIGWRFCSRWLCRSVCSYPYLENNFNTHLLALAYVTDIFRLSVPVNVQLLSIKNKIDNTLLTIIDKYDIPIGEWALLYQALLEVSRDKIALRIVSVQMTGQPNSPSLLVMVTSFSVSIKIFTERIKLPFLARTLRYHGRLIHQTAGYTLTLWAAGDREPC